MPIIININYIIITIKIVFKNYCCYIVIIIVRVVVVVVVVLLFYFYMIVILIPLQTDASPAKLANLYSSAIFCGV